MSGLIEIGGCYSGLKCRLPDPYRRIALATPRAIDKLGHSRKLRALVAQLGFSPDVKPAHFTMLGAQIKAYIGRNDALSVALWLRSPAEEEALITSGMAAFRSLARGVHRELFFLRTGIRINPQINELAPNLYSAMLAKIRDGFNETTFEQIAAIAFTERPLDTITEGPDGKEVVFSLPQLSVYPSWAHIEED